MGEVVKTSGGVWQHSPARSEWMWAELCVLEGAQLSPGHWDGAGDNSGPCRHASSDARREFTVALSTGTGTRPSLLAAGQTCWGTEEPVHLARPAGDTLPWKRKG